MTGKNKPSLWIFAVCFLLLGILLSSCSTQQVVTFDDGESTETEFSLNIRDDLAETVEEKTYDTPADAFTEGLLDLFTVKAEDGRRVRLHNITSAYVFRYEGDSSPCIALCLDSESNRVPDYLFHCIDGKLIQSDLDMELYADENSEFLFIRNSEKALLRNYKDLQKGDSASKYIQQMILGFNGQVYDFLKMTEYDIPYDAKSDVAAIRESLLGTVQADALRFTGTESMETELYATVAVTENTEEYLQRELGIDFGDILTPDSIQTKTVR